MIGINTNVLSMVAQKNLGESQNALQTSMERLSSGLRINSAKDDAAGQAIANRMTAQINGLAQAQRNANDGISIAQTAEGGLNQINDNLQRIRELSVQAQNGTNSDNDLQSIQDEVDQRLSEINRISKETDFNGTRVLSETADALTIQVGSEDDQTISVNLETINAAALSLADFSVTGDRQITSEQLVDQFDAALTSSSYNVVDGDGNVTDTYNIDGATGDVTNGAGAAINVATDGTLTTDATETLNATEASDIIATGSDWTASAGPANDAATLSDTIGQMGSGDTVTTADASYSFDGTDFTSTQTLSNAEAATAVQNQTISIDDGNGFTADLTVDGTGNITEIDGAAVTSSNTLVQTGGVLSIASAGGGDADIVSASDLFDGAVDGFDATFGSTSLTFDGTSSTTEEVTGLTAGDVETAIGATAATFGAIDSAGSYEWTGTALEDGGEAVYVDGSTLTDVGVDADGNGTYTIDIDGETYTAEVSGVAADGTGGTIDTLQDGASGSADLYVAGDGSTTDEGTVNLEAATLADVEAQDGAELESAEYNIASGDFAGDYFVGADELVRTSNDFEAEDNIVHLSRTEEGEPTLTSGAEVNTATTDPMATLDSALKQIDSLRSELGAVQNRFEDAITNLNTNQTNLADARSRIEDADYAKEVAEMTKNQILQQAGTSVLAQANQIPQGVLSLLG